MEQLNGLALCAGVGGLELGIKTLLGVKYRCVAYIERDAYAASALVARMEDSALDRAPVWDDLSTFEGRCWRGLVDIISAGIPCQPFSIAGKRRGTSDKRWLWPEVIHSIREIQPAIVFVENPTGILAPGGADKILADLAALGYDAEWDVFSAGEYGAPHKRERVFFFAYTKGTRWLGHINTALKRTKTQTEPCGLRWWGTQTDVRRVDDGTPYRMDRLRCAGNGVLPLVAAIAFANLARRARIRAS